MAVRGRVRALILQRDGFQCVFCFRGRGDGIKLQVDHIVPQARGGLDTLGNLAALCDECNRGKSDQYLGNYTAPSAGGPAGPLHVPLFRVRANATSRHWHSFRPEWALILEGTPPATLTYIEWRWRSRYCLTNWTGWYLSELETRRLMGTLDFSGEPIREDERLTGYDLGVEIRCPWSMGRRHELHVFQLRRHDIEAKTLMDHDAARIPADVWFEPADNG